MKKIILFLSLLASVNAYSQDASNKLSAIFKAIETFENNLDPEDSLFMGQHIKGPFSKISEETELARSIQYQQFVADMNKIPDNGLSRQEYISKQIMLLKLENSVSSVKYKMFLIPINSEGGIYTSFNRVLGRLPFNSVQDYQDYLGWLPDYVEWLADYLKLMKKGVTQGIVAPKVVINNNIRFIEPWKPDDFSNHPLYAPLINMPEDWEHEVKEELRQKAQIIITNQIIPFYQRLDNFLRNEYLSASPDKPGIKYLSDGEKFYEDRVRHFTTLKLHPDSVYALGIQEVARIKSLMLEVINEIGFTGSFDDFLNFLRTDEQFYAKTPQELLNYAAWLSKKAEGQLPKLFKQLYSLPFTVAPVPDDIAPTYTGGRYVFGSWQQQQPGTYWVNTYKLDSRPLYTLPPLTLHEAVPGHHLQSTLASEITGNPDFRKSYYISAFGEGWGLYSEFLGEEMGMYPSPYDRFGRYTYEMWRACRLVVDTGIHYRGWSRDEAIDYMKSNTALSLHEVNTEIDRYIGWPGQAVSYKIGEIKIKDLRKKAEEQLGEEFDIREFHYHILKNGSVPLPILEEEIERYIKSEVISKVK